MFWDLSSVVRSVHRIGKKGRLRGGAGLPYTLASYCGISGTDSLSCISLNPLPRLTVLELGGTITRGNTVDWSSLQIGRLACKGWFNPTEQFH